MNEWLGYWHYVPWAVLWISIVCLIPTIIGLIAFPFYKADFERKEKKSRETWNKEHAPYTCRKEEWRYDRLPNWVRVCILGRDDNNWLCVISVLHWVIYVAVIIMLSIFFLNPPDVYINQYKPAKEYFENKETICAEALIDHPTVTYIVEKEKEVAKLKGNKFFTDEFKNDPSNFIDTERLWATFDNNVHGKELEYYIMEDLIGQD